MRAKLLAFERLLRSELDLWFGTLARYLGVALGGYSLFVDHGKNPALWPAALGLVFLKNVLKGGSE